MYRFSTLARLMVAGALFVPTAVAAGEREAPHTQDNTAFMQEFTLSGTLGAVSDYSFRGISQSDERPVLQGGLEIAHDSGFYVGIWGSGVELNDGDEAFTEVDFIGGYRFDSGPWSGNASLQYYAYPGADKDLNYNYTELLLSGAYDFDYLSLGAQYAYTPDNFGHTDDAHYVQGKLDVPLPYGFTSHAYLGYQMYDKNDEVGMPDYADWNIGVGYSFERVDVDLSYVDTNLDSTDCPQGCDARVIASLIYKF